MRPVDCTPKLPARDTSLLLSYFNYTEILAIHGTSFKTFIHSFIHSFIQPRSGLWQQSGMYSAQTYGQGVGSELARARESANAIG